MGTKTLLSLSYALSSPSGLLVADTLGGYEVNKSQSGAVSAVKSLNTTLTDACVAVGAILIAIAVVKIIIAMASEDSKGKMDSGMLFGRRYCFYKHFRRNQSTWYPKYDFLNVWASNGS